jgi:peptidoglycan/xylan/chitin deacetylase (PgdA/CDA1 family)
VSPVPRAGKAAAWIGAGALAAQYVPSTAVLGQWSSLRTVGGGACRWRGPRIPQVAITFDDGPHPVATPAVLDELDRLGWRATFFCLGDLVERHHDLVAEITARGHEVGSHGHRHAHHLFRPPRWIADDVRASVDALRGCGVDPRFYRPTYGQLTGATLAAAWRLGLETVLWSAWGREWTTTDHGRVADQVGAGLGPGAIVLLHDNDAFGPPGMWEVGLAALDRIAGELDRRGLQPTTLGELVDAGAREEKA